MSGVNYTRVWEVHSMLHPKPDDLISTSRFFVREGELLIWDDKRKKKKKRYFFLFNDILLFTKQESPKKYWLRIHITLRSPYVSVEDVENSTVEFHLHCRMRSFALWICGYDSKMDWVEDIKKSISGQHKEELENKKLQQITKTVTSDADVVKETEMDEEAKKEKERRKKEKRKEGNGEEKPEGSTKKKREPKKSPRPSNNNTTFDPFAQTLMPPSQNTPALVHSSPGQFQNPFGLPPRANTHNAIPTMHTASSDLFGVNSGTSHVTGSLAGTSSATPLSNYVSLPLIPPGAPSTGNPFSPRQQPTNNPFAGLGSNSGLGMTAPSLSNPFGNTGAVTGGPPASYSYGVIRGPSLSVPSLGVQAPAQVSGYNPFVPSNPSQSPNPFFN